MKKHIAILTICLACAGCWMFEEQRVALTPETVAELQTKFGDDFEAMRAEVEAMLGAEVEKIKEIEGGLVAVLSPPAEEAAKVAGGSLISKLVSNPTMQDALAAVGFSILAGFGVIRGRAKWKNGKKKPE